MLQKPNTLNCKPPQQKPINAECSGVRDCSESVVVPIVVAQWLNPPTFHPPWGPHSWKSITKIPAKIPKTKRKCPNGCPSHFCLCPLNSLLVSFIIMLKYILWLHPNPTIIILFKLFITIYNYECVYMHVIHFIYSRVI